MNVKPDGFLTVLLRGLNFVNITIFINGQIKAFVTVFLMLFCLVGNLFCPRTGPDFGMRRRRRVQGRADLKTQSSIHTWVQILSAGISARESALLYADFQSPEWQKLHCDTFPTLWMQISCMLSAFFCILSAIFLQFRSAALRVCIHVWMTEQQEKLRRLYN